MKVSMLKACSLTALVSGMGLANVALAPVTYAQENAAAAESEKSLSTVYVTGVRKRAEDTQDVPVSVSGFTADDLVEQNIASLADLGNSTPGLLVNNIGGGTFQTIHVRGLAPANTSTDLNVDSNVGVFIDGIYQTSRNTLDILSVLDVASVELAKGPQSALFGRSTFAGALSISTANPSDEFGADVSATVGTDKDYRLKGSITGPIAENLSGRLAIGYATYDGFAENQDSSDNLGGYEKYAVAGALEWTPTADFTANLNAFITHAETEYQGMTLTDIYDNNCGNQAGGIYLMYCGEYDSAGTPDISAETQDTETDNFQISLSLEKDFENFTISTVTGYTENENYTYSDYDGTGGGIEYGVCDTTVYGFGCYAGLYDTTAFVNTGIKSIEKVDSFTQEIRIQSPDDQALTWMAGANYFKSNIPFAGSGLGAGGEGVDPATDNLIYLAPTVGWDWGSLVLVDDPFTTFRYSSYSKASTESYSVFGALGYDFGQVRVNAEGRWTTDKKHAEVFSPVTGSYVTLDSDFAKANEYDKTFRNFTPRFTVDYQPMDNVMFYGSASRGVRSGGFNTRNAASATGILESEVAYKEETNWTYEAGMKSNLLDDALMLNVALFHVDWKDAQVNSYTQNPGALNPINIVSNAGELTSDGFEITTEYEINEMFSVGGSLIKSTSEFGEGAFDSSRAAQCVDATNSPAPGCPKVIMITTAAGATLYVPGIEGNLAPRSVEDQWNLHASMEKPLSGDWMMSGRVDVNYTGPVYPDLVNSAEFGERTLTNLRVAFDKGPYTIAFWANNLFDEDYIQNVISQPRSGMPTTFRVPELYLGESRRVGVTLSASF